MHSITCSFNWGNVELSFNPEDLTVEVITQMSGTSISEMFALNLKASDVAKSFIDLPSYERVVPVSSLQRLRQLYAVCLDWPVPSDEPDPFAQPRDSYEEWAATRSLDEVNNANRRGRLHNLNVLGNR